MDRLAFSPTATVLLQKYEHYLPTAFDESLTLTQKVNKLAEHLNVVVEDFNQFGGVVSETTNKHMENVLQGLADQTLTISEIENDVETFKNVVTTDLLPTGVTSTLDNWYTSGKLATLINDDVFDMKADKNTVDFMLNKPLMKNGLIKLPSDFPKTFNATRIAKRVYEHNETPYTVHDWSNATEIFISGVNSVSGADGTNPLQPITLSKFTSIMDSGYGSQTSFILNFQENFYNGSASFSPPATDKNLLFRSASNSGFTWVGRSKIPAKGETATKWAQSEGVYKSTILDTPSHEIPDVVNLVAVDEFGIPKPYKKTTSLQATQLERGTFYQTGADIYANPHTGESINHLTLTVKAKLISVVNSGGVVVFDRMGFLSQEGAFTGNTINARYHFFNCKFYRGLQDALAVSGVYQVFLYDSVSAYANKDGLNYHTTSRDSLAVEINCISYGDGQYKMANGNMTTISNNGSTAHDGMHMLRIGCKYWDCEGPIIADVNDCYSISIGCEVGNTLATNTGSKAGIYLTDDGAVNPRPKYVIECLVNGKDLDYGINSKVANGVNVMDFEGTTVNDGNLTQIDWDVIT